MKKLVISLFIVGFVSISINAQISSENLIKERKNELKALENADLPDKEKAQRMKEIDKLYKDLIAKAIEAETPSLPSPSEKTKLGTELVLNSPNGIFKSKNYRNPKESAEAYALVADANSRSQMMNAVANSISTDNGKIEATNDPYNTGFEGAFFNRYRNQMVDITIIGINNSYRKTFSVRANSVQYIRLLPGNYRVIAKGERDSKPGEIIITVDGFKDFRGDDGKDYIFGANIGRS